MLSVVDDSLSSCQERNDCFEFHEGTNEFMVGWRAVYPRDSTTSNASHDPALRPRSEIYTSSSLIRKITTISVYPSPRPVRRAFPFIPAKMQARIDAAVSRQISLPPRERKISDSTGNPGTRRQILPIRGFSRSGKKFPAGRSSETHRLRKVVQRKSAFNCRTSCRGSARSAHRCVSPDKNSSWRRASIAGRLVASIHRRKFIGSRSVGAAPRNRPTRERGKPIKSTVVSDGSPPETNKRVDGRRR